MNILKFGVVKITFKIQFIIIFIILFKKSVSNILILSKLLDFQKHLKQIRIKSWNRKKFPGKKF